MNRSVLIAQVLVTKKDRTLIWKEREVRQPNESVHRFSEHVYNVVGTKVVHKQLLKGGCLNPKRSTGKSDIIGFIVAVFQIWQKSPLLLLVNGAERNLSTAKRN